MNKTTWGTQIICSNYNIAEVFWSHKNTQIEKKKKTADAKQRSKFQIKIINNEINKKYIK
jgi:hypothetical protein